MLKEQQDRHQLQMLLLDHLVSQQNIVRVIDTFVDLLDLEEIGFKVKGGIKNGAPAFRIGDLLNYIITDI